jgi:hypothetical protein
LPALLLTKPGQAQLYDTEQLILDVQKLSQLKQILTDLRAGYQTLDAGYSAIRDVAQGSFNLHKAFLDGLLAVSPAVRNYQRVIAIVDLQAGMLSKYQQAWAYFQQRGSKPEELVLIAQVYKGLLAESAQNLRDLTNIVTDGVLRASDAERMRQIDVIYDRMAERAGFLDRFTNSTALLLLQRQGLGQEDLSLQQLYGIKP